VRGLEAEIVFVRDQRADGHGEPRNARERRCRQTATRLTAMARAAPARRWQVRVAGWIRFMSSHLREHPLRQQRERGVGLGAGDPSFSTAETPPATPLPVELLHGPEALRHCLATVLPSELLY
jgi:hypothetical protein